MKLASSPFLCLLVTILFVYPSCSNKPTQSPLFELLENTGIRFSNNVEDAPMENSFLFRNFYNGGGVAIGDLNNDGRADVLLTSNMGNNQLYLNQGSLRFEDITGKSGIRQDGQWSTGVTFADINSDGWLDIYICNSGHMQTGRRKNQLWINNHNLTFTEAAAAYGLDITGYATQVSFFDYDLDGDLDMFLINNSPIPVNQLGYSNRRDLPEAQWPVADFLKGGGDHLYRNDVGRYTEVTRDAGIHGSLISFGLGVSVGDINNDGYPDVYVANDSYERDYLYINQKNGTFKDDLEKCMGHTSFSSMGADIADINNDGYAEIFTTDMLPEDDYRLKTLGAFDNIDLYRSKIKAGFYHQFMMNCLQLNNRNGTFSEIAHYSGVSATDWSWGALLFDADNDGFNDIYVCNGVNRDVTNLDFMDFFANDVLQKMVLTGKKDGIDQVLKEIPRNPMVNKAFRNTGNLRFTDAGTAWGFTQPSYSNGAAYGDLDNDGDLDLVINNENQPAFVYRNRARELGKHNFIGLSLKGTGKNTFAIGSSVKVYAGNQVILREQMPSRGFQSSVDYKLIIGLGTAARIDSMVVTWPDLTATTLVQPAVNTVHALVQTKGKERMPEEQHTTAAPLLAAETPRFDKHLEDDHVDFYYERNLPVMTSREGPRAASGDVNGDGLEDVFIGGAAGQAGQLYLQTAKGSFLKKNNPGFEQYADFEDVAVLLFDSDKDGDLDLLVCPGGNSFPPESREMQFRLYKNDGKANFVLDVNAFPVNGVNIAVAVANDFDQDGDADLFAGGRNIPMRYGLIPSSYVFVNDGNGHFTDMAPVMNPDIAKIGMVTDALWADVAGDKKEELVITGEWMPTRIFSFAGDRFREITSNLNELSGWWQTIAAADLNHDGRKDLILGNLGENFYLHPGQQNPVKLWINDFNQNGNIDKVMTRTVEGKDKPVFLKHEMEDQIPRLKKQSLKHHQFAAKSMQELFNEEMINTSTVKQLNYASSCIAINQGNGKFTVKNLPQAAQLSSINAIHCTDINADGVTDLVIGGNKLAFLPQFGNLDASYGLVLLNNSKGGFSTIPAATSGLVVSGEVRDITPIAGKSGSRLLFLRNNDFPVMYRLNFPLKN